LASAVTPEIYLSDFNIAAILPVWIADKLPGSQFAKVFLTPKANRAGSVFFPIAAPAKGEQNRRI